MKQEPVSGYKGILLVLWGFLAFVVVYLLMTRSNFFTNAAAGVSLVINGANP